MVLNEMSMGEFGEMCNEASIIIFIAFMRDCSN